MGSSGSLGNTGSGVFLTSMGPGGGQAGALGLPHPAAPGTPGSVESASMGGTRGSMTGGGLGASSMAANAPGTAGQ